jgi:hypothetical protein
MPKLPKVHAAVVGIEDHDDGESIATAAAQAALELLCKVSTQARSNVQLDRIAIVEPTPANDFLNLLRPPIARYAVMVTCKVIEESKDQSDTKGDA